MILRVNGAKREIHPAGHETLLRVLRETLGLTGTKESCARGECGACTVLLANGDERARPVYSCLTLAVACEGASVTTIEGLGNGSHPLQQAFVAQDAVQCGFCTPGQIMAAAALLADNPRPDEPAIRAALSGNLCRCGTYPRIVLAVQEAARRMEDARGR